MKRITVRIVAPSLVLAGVVGYAATTGLPGHENDGTPTGSYRVRSAQSQATPFPSDGTNLAVASAVGLLRIDYRFERQGRPASNQFAIWIETAGGAYVDTVFATSWIANGGWSRRPMSMPQWREASNWADATRGQTESASRPAPASGAQTVYWDGLDAQGLPVPGGDYVLAEEAGEFKDHRALRADELVSDARTDLGEQELIDESLFKVLFVLLGTQRLAEPSGTYGGKHHHASLGSAIFRTDHEYHGSFRNHENISDITVGGEMGTFGEYTRGTRDPDSRHELTGFETVTATGAPGSRSVSEEAPVPDEVPVREEATGWRNRLKAQQETAAGGGADGYSDDDPWFGKNATAEGYAQPARGQEPVF